MIHSQNTIAIVIWFHPTQQEVQAITHYCEEVKKVLIIDNSSESNEVLAACLPNVEYHSLGCNRGVAFALNYGFRLAQEQGAEWVLTMDQDSIWEPHAVTHFMAEANAYSSADKVAIFAPTLVMGHPVHSSQSRYDCPWKVMTSGNLVYLPAWQKVKGFRDDFFIDNVDDEFNCHLAQAGWKIVRIASVCLTHHLGEGYRTWVDGKHTYTPHSAERYFYIGRNIQRMRQLYPEHAAYYRHRAWKELKRLFLYDNHDKGTKIRTYLKGWQQGAQTYPTPFRIIVAPGAEHLRAFMEQIPYRFYVEGKVIYNARNQIRVITLPSGEQINVKRYRRPRFLNRYIYSTLRLPKAVRAYHNALRLEQEHIPTPKVYGVILCGKRWLNESYLITRQEPLTHLFYEFKEHSVQGYEDVIQALAQLIARMHEKGMVHKDLSPGNILWDRDKNGQVQISVVDINRMQFKKHLSFRACCRNFCRLWGQADFIPALSRAYARQKQWNEEKTQKWILHYWLRFWRGRSI